MNKKHCVSHNNRGSIEKDKSKLRSLRNEMIRALNNVK